MSEVKRAYRMLKGYIQHEFDRITSYEHDSAESELDQPLPAKSNAQEPKPVVFDAEMARSYLGLETGATFEQIKTKYDELVKRSNPDQFEPGTTEFRQASAIQRRIHRAYSLLTDEVSVTEKRFKSLELD